jgi:hypothetical protein
VEFVGKNQTFPQKHRYWLFGVGRKGDDVIQKHGASASYDNDRWVPKDGSLRH